LQPRDLHSDLYSDPVLPFDEQNMAFCGRTFWIVFETIPILSHRGFVEGGWKEIQNSEGDLTEISSLFHVSTEEFETELISQLEDYDTVIFTDVVNGNYEISAKFQRILDAIKIKKAKTALILFGNCTHTIQLEGLDKIVTVQLERTDLLKGVPSLAEFSAKLVFNGISTSSCIQKGRVMGNRMINLSVRHVIFHSIA